MHLKPVLKHTPAKQLLGGIVHQGIEFQTYSFGYNFRLPVHTFILFFVHDYFHICH